MKNKQNGFMGIAVIILIAIAIIGGGTYVYSTQKTDSKAVDFSGDASVSTASSSAIATTDIKIDSSVNEEAVGFILFAYTKGGKNYIDIDYITLRHEAGDMPWGTIVNDNDKIRTFELSQNVSIKLTNRIVNGVMTMGNYNIGFGEFEKIFNSKTDFRAGNPWNISVKNGVIVEIRENFRS